MIFCARPATRWPGPEIVSCPTCGRTNIDVAGIANEVERRLRERGCTRSIKVAVMGCVVNGPGEAKEADIGIAGGKRLRPAVCKGPAEAYAARRYCGQD